MNCDTIKSSFDMSQSRKTVEKQQLPWKTLSSKTLYKTRWCTVREDTVQLPNGKILDDYSVVNLPDVVMVFALTKKRNVLFVKQYRYGVDKVLLELPAGSYVKGKERPENAAKRELWEETGYRALKLERLSTVNEYPTKDAHSITIYFTENPICEGSNHQEETEDIQVVEVPFEKLDEYIRKGKIAVAGSIAAIYLAKQHLDK